MTLKYFLVKTDMRNCGGGSIGIAHAYLYLDGSGTVKKDVPVEEVFASIALKYPKWVNGRNMEGFFDGLYGTGFNYTAYKDGRIWYVVRNKEFIHINIYNSFGPYYELYVNRIEVKPGFSVGGAYADVLSWATPGTKPYNFSTGKPDNADCRLPTIPELPPNPTKGKEDDMSCCDCKQIAAIMKKTLNNATFSINVPVVSCVFENNKWVPKIEYKDFEVFATSKAQAEQIAQLHKVNAEQAVELCEKKNEEPIASLPLSFQIRNEGNRPQLVIQCAAKNDRGEWGSAMYPITVPHWKGGINDRPSLPVYRKGNHEGILVLADNSRVTINAANRAECIKILNALKPWIKKEMLQGSYFKSGDINTDIKIQQVKPMYGRYFPTGQKNSKPDWRVDFP